MLYSAQSMSASRADADKAEITRLLSDWSRGRSDVLDHLVPLVYEELRRIAKHHMRNQRPGHTLQATALIHEAYVKLLGSPGSRDWQDRAHFFRAASMAMRHILVNYAHSRLAGKRGGQPVLVPIEAIDVAGDREAGDVVAVHEALKDLAAFDERKARVVELRYFGGLSVEETAEALHVSMVTVSRDWQLARSWLARELGRPVA